MKNFMNKIFIFLFITFFPMTVFSDPVTTVNAFDTSFGTGGVATLAIEGHEERVYSTVEDHEGRLLVTGRYDPVGPTSSEVFIARFLPNGTIDTSFGTNGLAVISPTPQTDTMYAIGLQSDGKIIIAGRCHLNLCFMRYDPVENDWDDSFGDDSPTSPSKTIPPVSGRRFNENVSMQIDPADNSIILGTTIWDYPHHLSSNRDFIFAKLSASGANIGFGSPVLLVHNINNIHDRLGDILLHGDVLLAGGVIKEGDDQDIVILVIDKSTGSRVTTYGDNGLVQLEIVGSNEYLSDLAFSEAHGLFFAGLNGDNLILGKFNFIGDNLEIDTSFGNSGYVTTLLYDVRAIAHGIKFDHSDRVILQARQSIPMETDQLVVMRFCAASGLLDTSFGDSGLIFHESFSNWNNTLLLTNNHSRIVVGTYGRINNSTIDMVLLGYINPEATICPVPATAETGADIDTGAEADTGAGDMPLESGADDGNLEGDVLVDTSDDVEDMPGDSAEGDGGCSCDFRQASTPLPLTPFLIFLGITIFSFLQIRKLTAERSKH